MKIKLILALAALAISTATVAKADTLNLVGSAHTDTTADTISGLTAGAIVPTTDGVFAPWNSPLNLILNTGTLNFGTLGAIPTYQLLSSLDSASDTLGIFLNDVTSFGAMGSGFGVQGTGFYTIDAGAGHAINWVFTTQPGTGLTSFSVTVATPSAVPEPESLALFGTGLLAVVGAARRRFKNA